MAAMLENLTYGHIKPLLLLSASLLAAVVATTVWFPDIFPLSVAQVLPEDQDQSTQNNMTIGLTSSTVNTHTSYTIEGSSALLKSKVPMIKKAVIGQMYGAIGLGQKGSNDTSARLNALIVNEIDNSTSKATTLGTTKSLTGIQISNAIDKLVSSNSDNNTISNPQLRKIIVENEAQCLPSSSGPSDCSLKIRIHQ